MKKTRLEKGITLIALIITIVVLLILAVVTIGAIQESKIIAHAKNAATGYNDEKSKEESIISGYESLIDSKLPGGNSGSKVTYKDGVPVPSGFYYVTGTKDTGFVISDNPADENNASGKSGNQFVWVPVYNIDSFARLQEGSEENYRGILYDDTALKNEIKYFWEYHEGNGEPANLPSRYDNTSNMARWNEMLYQDSFNKMVASVTKYGGFYVGRYETSLNGNIAQSKAGVTPMNNLNWYRMYEYSLTYSTSNKSLSIVSEMIWGCQWDAMLKFILTGNEASHVAATINVGHTASDFTIYPYQTKGMNYSDAYKGSVKYNDVASNIYDLEGNVAEWTQEVWFEENIGRILRGR